MKWTQIEGQWNQLTGEVKSKWAKLVDESRKSAAGTKAQIASMLNEHYGVFKQDAKTAEEQVAKWIAKIKPRPRNRSN